ncbi:MAG: hypothetical protein WBR24_07660 [Desulfobacterales bacterium]|jgi:hypothetical protein
MHPKQFSRIIVLVFCLFWMTTSPVRGEFDCGEDGTQTSGSKYRICMPTDVPYNGKLVIWAHGFQDATDSVGIPEDQLSFGSISIPDIITSFGYGFATNSYSKTGLAVVQGQEDIVDLVSIYNDYIYLGGFPFENRWTWYRGSNNDFLLNLFVPRRSADPAAIAEMKSKYNTTGQLSVPLLTIHTLHDQQVPYFHEFLYNLNTLSQGSLWTEHVNIPINRFGHCNFTPDEALLGFGLMLLYAGEMDTLEGVGSMLRDEELSSFESLAERFGLPYNLGGNRLRLK